MSSAKTASSSTMSVRDLPRPTALKELAHSRSLARKTEKEISKAGLRILP